MAIGVVAASLIGALLADSPDCVTTAESTGQELGRRLSRAPRVAGRARETLGLTVDYCGSRRVSTISLQIMINLRFSVWEIRRR